MDNVLPNKIINNTQTPPLVQPENPGEIKSPNGINRKTRKNLLKVVGGLMMALLIIGGLFIGKNVVQERQVVEKNAFNPKSRQRCAERTTEDSCNNSCHVVDGYGCHWVNSECKAYLEPACKNKRDNNENGIFDFEVGAGDETCI